MAFSSGQSASVMASGQERRLAPSVVDADEDHAVVFEIGAAGDWEPDERAIHGGGTFAFDVTPIEHWLELEIGVTALAAGAGVEMPIGVLIGK